MSSSAATGRGTGARSARTRLEQWAARFESPMTTYYLLLGVVGLLVGIGLVMAKSPATDRLQEAIQGLFEVTMKLINLFIKLAPLAIACLMFNLTALFGLELLVRLAAFVGVAVGAMAIHMFVVYSLMLKFLGGWSPARFFRSDR